MMGKKFVLFALAVITSIAAVSVHGAETKKEKLVKKAKGEKKVADVVWQKDVAKAIAAAKKSKKPDPCRVFTALFSFSACFGITRQTSFPLFLIANVVEYPCNTF